MRVYRCVVSLNLSRNGWAMCKRANANSPTEAQEICCDSGKEVGDGAPERPLAKDCRRVVKSTVGDIWKYYQKLEDCISSSERREGGCGFSQWRRENGHGCR